MTKTIRITKKVCECKKVYKLEKIRECKKAYN